MQASIGLAVRLSRPAVALVTGNDVLSVLLDPLRGVDIATTYAEHASFIDFGIYLLLFTAISHAVFQRRFPGRSGKAIAVTVGLMLAVALASAGASWGFTLASLGPIAAAAVIFVAALVLFSLLHRMGMSKISAAAVTFVAVYLALRAVSPAFFDDLMMNGLSLWLAAAFWVAVVVGLVKLAGHLRASGDAGMSRLAGRMRSVRAAPLRLLATRDREKGERRLVRRNMRRPTRQDARDSDRIIRELQDINRTLSSGSATRPQGVAHVAECLEHISSREGALLERLRDLRRLTDRAEESDVAAYRELLEDRRRGCAPPGNAAEMEWLKIRLEERLRQFETGVSQYDAHLRYCLQQAVDAFKRGDIRAAMYWVAEAIRYEQQARDTFRDMDRLEKGILRLTAKEMKMLPPPSTP